MKNIRNNLGCLIVLVLFSQCTLLDVKTSAQTIPPEKFKQALEKEHGILIDVRTPEEYMAEHLAGAFNMNVRSDNFKAQVDSLDKSKTYFLYCKGGKRGEEAVNIMKTAGFNNLYNLKGGIEQWKKKGFEVIKIEQSQ